MRLINVAAVLGIESNIDPGKEVNTATEIFGEFYGADLEEKEYAILSHCWGVVKQGEKEVSFKEINKLLVMSEGMRNEIRGRTGYKKIIDTCRQAQKDRLEWVWIDTCCIDKNSSPELSEAINSMYKWYANAELCYAYLHDTEGDPWQHGRMHSWEDRQKSTPKWFSRGWTLQELIAPKVVHFFDQKWERIGDKAELAWTLSGITRIPGRVLKEGLQKALTSVHDYERPSVAQIFSWAADRTTTREEDWTYSLLGLLGVHIPLLYGEGKNAFRRLQLEIIRTSNDQSIFAWAILIGCSGGPAASWQTTRVTSLEPETFTTYLSGEDSRTMHSASARKNSFVRSW
ncbi:heterokaryon incompatibility protein-domain-containing protein [Pisolithus marmoratus]|nr:heterokaryon incompatibility protein-domain-containing protein [Pisolithus marmoratus]